MMLEFHSPTLVCSYSVADFRVASQACGGSVSLVPVEDMPDDIGGGLPGSACDGHTSVVILVSSGIGMGWKEKSVNVGLELYSEVSCL